MFTSDKELRGRRPAGPSRGRPSGTKTSTPVSSAANHDVIELARHAREERQFQREHSRIVTRLQAWWRCQHQLRKWERTNASELNRKLEDIRKVNQMLRMVVCPDAKISVHLARLLLFTSRSEMGHLLLPLCDLALRPSLSNMDPIKNMASLLSPYLACRIFDVCLLYLAPRPRYSAAPSPEDQTTVVTCLNLLIGGGMSFRMRFAAHLEYSFKRIRRELELRRVLHRVGALLFSRLENWMLSTNDHDDSGHTPPSRSVTSAPLDGLLVFCSDFIQSDSEARSSRLMLLIREVLSVPMASLLFSATAVGEFVDTEIVDSVVATCIRLIPALDLSVSSIPALQSEIWLLGNLVALFRHRLKASTSILESYLQLISKLIIAHPVPGLLQGKRGVVWTRRGTESIAAGVPTGLYIQMNTLFDFEVLTSLCETFLGFDIGTFEGNQKDDAEISDALRSNSMSLTAASISEAAADRSWTSGRWAMKILSSVSGSFINHRKATTSRRADSFEIDSSSIFRLTGLWAVTIVPAALGSYSSENWKGISTLAFSSLSLTLRLWRVVRHLRIENFCAHFSPTKDVSYEGFFGIMATLAAVLRVHLLVCGDQELIEEGRPMSLHQIYVLIRCFKQVLFKMVQHDSSLLCDSSAESFISLSAKVMSLMLKNLHARWSRRPFSLPSLFEIPEANTHHMRGELRYRSPFASALLNNMYAMSNEQ